MIHCESPPALLRAQPQHFRTFGALGALGPPVGVQPEVSVGLLERGRLQRPDGAEAKRPAALTGTHCGEHGNTRNEASASPPHHHMLLLMEGRHREDAGCAASPPAWV